MGPFLGSSCSTDLFSRPPYRSTDDCLVKLNVEQTDASHPFLHLRDCSSRPALPFHVDFRVRLSIAAKSLAVILVRTVLNPELHLWSVES